MILLLDADSLVYAACCSHEDSDDILTEQEAKDKYDRSFGKLINEIGELVSVEDVQTFNGSRGNFRKFIGSRNSYKANRTRELPEHLNAVHSYLHTDYNGIKGYGVETDDMVARSWTKLSRDLGRDNVMIVSIDKDYRQLPCFLYNYHWKRKEMYDISEEEARYNFYAQMVCGDQADNVNFFLGKGPSFCQKYFQECKTEYQYKKKLFFLFKEKYKSKAREKYIECYNLLRLKTE
mgnify:FL=1|tara:strand:+ start:5161 stop:5865 length:705 start_codon:yes stop_codon:yes gene_type:complete